MQERVLCWVPCQVLQTGSCYPPLPSPTERRRCSDNTVLCWGAVGVWYLLGGVGGGIEGCSHVNTPHLQEGRRRASELGQLAQQRPDGQQVGGSGCPSLNRVREEEEGRGHARGGLPS